MPDWREVSEAVAESSDRFSGCGDANLACKVIWQIKVIRGFLQSFNYMASLLCKLRMQGDGIIEGCFIKECITAHNHYMKLQ